MSTSRNNDPPRLISSHQQNLLNLLRYEVHQLVRSPFIIGLIPLFVFIHFERFNEVYNFWGPSGGYAFSQFGTTIYAQGVILFIIELGFIIVLALLFLFRDFDEGLHKLQLAFPFQRIEYVFVKFAVLAVLALLLSFAFVSGTFVLIPLRNPTIGFQAISVLGVPFLAYGMIAVAISALGICLGVITLNSRNTVFSWGSAVVIWLYTSLNIQMGIERHNWGEAFSSHFSLTSIERVMEYFIIRVIIPSDRLDYYLDRLMYKNDTLLNPLLVLGFYLLIILVCLVVAFIIFRRRDL